MIPQSPKGKITEEANEKSKEDPSHTNLSPHAVGPRGLIECTTDDEDTTEIEFNFFLNMFKPKWKVTIG